MSRRGSSSSFSSSSDVNFDDLDDQQVFGFLGDDGDPRLSSPGSRPRRLPLGFIIEGQCFTSPAFSDVSSCPKQTCHSQERCYFQAAFSILNCEVKRIVKRPSSLSISTPASKLVSQKRESLSENVLQVSKDSDRDSFFEMVTTATTTSTLTTSDGRDELVDTERVSESKEAPVGLSSEPRKAKAAESSSGTGTPLGNANALVAALALLQAQVELLTSEKTQMEVEVVAARTTIDNLEQKLAASEQSSDLFARQLTNVKESFQANLMAREEEVSLEKMTLVKEKETQLQHQQARFTTEAELWKQEIATLTKVKLELEGENDRLNKELNDEDLQRGFAEAKHRTLKAEHAHTREELQMLLLERGRFELAQVEIQELRSKMADDRQNHELQRQQLEERVSKVLADREGQVAGWERERQDSISQNEKEKSQLLRFVQEVRGLHHLLQLSVGEARELFTMEVKKTKDTLEGIQQQTSEFAVHQSDREVALMSRKGRILQLETQLKNDRQTINQLETTLAKSTRALEKKHAALRAKFQEQKEHLEITLAVRQGLTTDLQTKRKHCAELEREVARLNLAKGKADVKLKHSQQQILAMQKVHARDLEKLAKKSSDVVGSSNVEQTHPPDPPQEENNESRAAAHDGLEEIEWQEFVELVAAYEAERQLHAELTVH
ncbi:hypothetical protein PHYPSEUDO_007979 [Phytophthora pseudosyringae]|uniref:Uncharacterized protein n=1 Tax=Phytophthora pseudosyringae TaxID=221518 RepID=A0A8T1WAV3_9STRA|nr:hypothetical protein PHYPSEUDO_007979 [Phytophthora pseudosyringae]